MSSMGRIALAPDRAGAPPVRLQAVQAQAEARAQIRDAAAALDDLAGEWAALAAEASEPNPFAEHWFIAASLPAMAVGREVKLVEVRRGERLIGLMPVAAETGYARLPVRLVKNWCHDQMFLGTPLIAAGEERAFWEAALDALDRAGWAGSFLHLRGMAEGGPVHRGLNAARPGAIAFREVRALLDSPLDPQAYYQAAVRQKKRKELRRLANRLAELGPVVHRRLDDPAELDAWCDTYLALERAGWKGEAGSALACAPATARFFRDAAHGAWRAGRLQFLRLDVGGAPVAMLVNFLTAPGSFSFKTVFDESYARFSPGVLIQLENLAILADPDIAWMDSCAVEDHPMIDSLWTGRRSIVRITVPLKGARRRLVFTLCRALELGSAAFRKLIK
jgi:CelD/BcsL family acetyltransferase involved in cellulose biosynthesis